MTFEWFKDGQYPYNNAESGKYVIETKNSISHLTILEIGLEDAGNWSCVVSNSDSFGTVHSDAIFTLLTITGKFDIPFSQTRYFDKLWRCVS